MYRSDTFGSDVPVCTPYVTKFPPSLTNLTGDLLVDAPDVGVSVIILHGYEAGTPHFDTHGP